MSAEGYESDQTRREFEALTFDLSLDLVSADEAQQTFHYSSMQAARIALELAIDQGKMWPRHGKPLHAPLNTWRDADESAYPNIPAPPELSRMALHKDKLEYGMRVTGAAYGYYLRVPDTDGEDVAIQKLQAEHLIRQTRLKQEDKAHFSGILQELIPLHPSLIDAEPHIVQKALEQLPVPGIAISPAPWPEVSIAAITAEIAEATGLDTFPDDLAEALIWRNRWIFKTLSPGYPPRLTDAALQLARSLDNRLLEADVTMPIQENGLRAVIRKYAVPLELLERIEGLS